MGKTSVNIFCSKFLFLKKIGYLFFFFDQNFSKKERNQLKSFSNHYRIITTHVYNEWEHFLFIFLPKKYWLKIFLTHYIYVYRKYSIMVGEKIGYFVCFFLWKFSAYMYCKYPIMVWERFQLVSFFFGKILVNNLFTKQNKKIPIFFQK